MQNEKGRGDRMKFDKEYEVIDEVRTGVRKLKDGIKVVTEASEHNGVCILEYEIGTTGEKGGDWGHGSRTYMRFENLASTGMQIRVDGREIDGEKLEITFGGDDELSAIRGALEFFVSVLGRQAAKS
jgi:hypothetical protein